MSSAVPRPVAEDVEPSEVSSSLAEIYSETALGPSSLPLQHEARL